MRQTDDDIVRYLKMLGANPTDSNAVGDLRTFDRELRVVYCKPIRITTAGAS